MYNKKHLILDILNIMLSLLKEGSVKFEYNIVMYLLIEKKENACNEVTSHCCGIFFVLRKKYLRFWNSTEGQFVKND